MEINLWDNLIQPSGISQSETKPPRVWEFPQGEQLNAVTSIVNFYSDKLYCTIHTVLQNTKRMRSSQPGGFEQRLEFQTNNNIDIPSATCSKKSILVALGLKALPLYLNCQECLNKNELLTKTECNFLWTDCIRPVLPIASYNEAFSFQCWRAC